MVISRSPYRRARRKRQVADPTLYRPSSRLPSSWSADVSWSFIAHGATRADALAGFDAAQRKDIHCPQEWRQPIVDALIDLLAAVPADGPNVRFYLSTNGHINHDGTGSATVSLALLPPDRATTA